MRLIDADTLKPSYIVTSTTTNSLCHLYVSLEDINSAPTIEAEPVRRGRWIKYSPFVDTIVCSECDYNWPSEELKSNYCPDCGAKMREQE